MESILKAAGSSAVDGVAKHVWWSDKGCPVVRSRPGAVPLYPIWEEGESEGSSVSLALSLPSSRQPAIASSPGSPMVASLSASTLANSVVEDVPGSVAPGPALDAKRRRQLDSGSQGYARLAQRYRQHAHDALMRIQSDADHIDRVPKALAPLYLGLKVVQFLRKGVYSQQAQASLRALTFLQKNKRDLRAGDSVLRQGWHRVQKALQPKGSAAQGPTSGS